MALVRYRGGGFTHKRPIQKLVGATIDWNDEKIRANIDNAIGDVVETGAHMVEGLAKGIVRSQAYKTGKLYRSIRAYPSRYEGRVLGFRSKARSYLQWIVSAGGVGVDYAFHIETGRYDRETKKRIVAVPYLRRPLSIVRKRLRPLMVRRLKQAIK